MASWATEIRAWERAARGAGRRHGTIRLRTYYLELFADEAGTDPYDTTPDDISEWLADPHWQPETRKSARASLCTFYAWAVKTERTDYDPARVTGSIRVPPGVPRPAPASVLAAASQRATPRVRLMLHLAASAGLRRAEIAHLHVGDVVDGMIRVKGKGGKVRQVPLNENLAAELAAYIADSRCSGWLFPSRDGHLTPDRVGRLMSDALGPGWTAHTLRHRFGTRLYAGDHDLLQAQQLLGHASPATTQRYVAFPDETAVSAVNQMEWIP